MKPCQYINCSNLTSTKYCSFSCGTKQSHINNPPKRFSENRSCGNSGCMSTFTVTSQDKEKKYCSRSCAAQVNNVSSPKRKAVKQFENCLRCNKKLAIKQHRYCSNDCSSKHITDRKIASWLDGSWDGTVSDGLSRVIKLYLIDLAGNKCSSPTCAVPGGFKEINPTTGRCPLEVDHIDGNAYNNSIENLIVLCLNCHGLTPTYRGLNYGNSQRSYRSKYNKSSLQEIEETI